VLDALSVKCPPLLPLQLLIGGLTRLTHLWKSTMDPTSPEALSGVNICPALGVNVIRNHVER